MKLDVFAHQRDPDSIAFRPDTFYHLFPFLHIARPGVEAQFPTDDPGKMGFFQHQRRFIEDRQGDVFNDAVSLNVAEHGDLVIDVFIDMFIAPHDDHIR